MSRLASAYPEDEDVQELQETKAAVELLILIQLGPGFLHLAVIFVQQGGQVLDVTFPWEITVLVIEDQLDEQEADELLELTEVCGQEGGEVEHVVRMVQSEIFEVARKLL